MVCLKQTIPLQIFYRLFSTNFTWFILEYFITLVKNLTFNNRQNFLKFSIKLQVSRCVPYYCVLGMHADIYTLSHIKLRIQYTHEKIPNKKITMILIQILRHIYYNVLVSKFDGNELILEIYLATSQTSIMEIFSGNG